MINIDNYYFDVMQTNASFGKMVFNLILEFLIVGQICPPPRPSRNSGSPGQLGLTIQKLISADKKSYCRYATFVTWISF